MVRVKHRYFLLEIICEDFGKERILKLPFKGKDLYTAIHATICDVLGDYGSGALNDGLTVKMLNPYSRIAYLRTRRGPHLLLASVLPFVTRVNDQRCSLRTLYLGGTLRSCHRFLQRFHQRQLAVILTRCTSEDERQEVQDSIRLCLERVKPKKS